MDDLDKIDRLFALKENGALSDDEFQAEKRRLLGDRLSPIQEVTGINESAFHREQPYRPDITHKIVVSLVLLALLGAGFWLVRTDNRSNEAARTAPATAENERSALSSEPKSPKAPKSPSPRELKSMPDEQWATAGGGGSQKFEKIFYGPPESDSGYWLNCNRASRIAEFVSTGATSESGNSVVIDAGGAARLRADIQFETGEWEQASIAIPIDHQVLEALLNDARFLRVRWEKGAVDELPNSAILKAFIRSCRAS